MKGKFNYTLPNHVYFECEFVFTSKVMYLDFHNIDYLQNIDFEITYTPINRIKAKKVKKGDIEELNKFFSISMNCKNLFFSILAQSISQLIYQIIENIKNAY